MDDQSWFTPVHERLSGNSGGRADRVTRKRFDVAAFDIVAYSTRVASAAHSTFA